VKLWINADAFADLRERIAFYYRNTESLWEYGLRHQGMADAIPSLKDPLIHRTSGATISGTGLTKVDERTLRSQQPRTRQALTATVLTAQTDTPAAYLDQLTRLAASAESADLTSARAAHEAWWAAFWDRSRVQVTRANVPADRMTAATASPLRIGAGEPRGVSPFAGHIAQARVYNRPLNEAEIAALAGNAAAPPPQDGLLGNWDLAGRCKANPSPIDRPCDSVRGIWKSRTVRHWICPAAR
jgi:hypothetical protein